MSVSIYYTFNITIYKFVLIICISFVHLFVFNVALSWILSEMHDSVMPFGSLHTVDIVIFKKCDYSIVLNRNT